MIVRYIALTIYAYCYGYWGLAMEIKMALKKNINPTVTVITLTRNRSILLPRAIRSVLNQTYKEIEYIIIDGASRDNTEEVVKNFCDPRLKYFKLQENLSHPLSYDFAFRKSKGEFITFLDDDDEYLPEKIEKQVRLLTSLPTTYGFVYCWMDYFDDSTGLKVKEWHPMTQGNAYLIQIEHQRLGGTPTLFIRREAFKKVDGLNKTLKYVADWEFNTRLSRYYLTDFVPEVLVKVHINHGFERMQTKALTNERALALIEFHKYYLIEFKDGFDLYPHKKIPHLKSLCILSFRIKNFSKGFKYFKDFISCRPTIGCILRTIYRAFQAIMYRLPDYA